MQSPTPVEHDTQYIVGDPSTDYIVKCVCGWITGGHATADAAREAYYAHARDAQA